jgi:hypothetical protein
MPSLTADGNDRMATAARMGIAFQGEPGRSAIDHPRLLRASVAPRFGRLDDNAMSVEPT